MKRNSKLKKINFFKKNRKIADTINVESIAPEKKYLLKDFRNEILKFNQDSLFQKYLKSVKEVNEKKVTQTIDLGPERKF